MEVFVFNLDHSTTKTQLQELLKPVLLRQKIEAFNIHKTVGKSFAFLTVVDSLKGQKLLITVQSTTNTFLRNSSGRQIGFKASHKPADPHLLRVLQKEEKDAKTRKVSQNIGKQDQAVKNGNQNSDDEIKVIAIECGYWLRGKNTKTFMPHYAYDCDATLSRSSYTLKLKLGSNRFEAVMDFNNILSLAVSTVARKNAITISLSFAPKIYELLGWGDEFQLVDFLSRLNLTSKATKFRNSKLPDSDQTVIGTCLTYRFILAQDVHLSILKRQLRVMTSNQIPITTAHDTSTRAAVSSLQITITVVDRELQLLNASFGWRFQVHALWANGALSPSEVQLLLPAMVSLNARCGDSVLVEVLRKLSSQLRYKDIDSGGVQTALEIMSQQEKNVLMQAKASQPKANEDNVDVYRVTVTPAGIYLYGPEEMASNRVLRQHRQNQDCFLRVTLSDEDGERVPFDRDVSNERILRGRFLTLLNDGLHIAGEHFNFLGFSHSSLRSQTCWFMRPFQSEGVQLNARSLIESLGDFSHIRNPAKCAARIGQAFSDTHSPVQIEPSLVSTIPDIRRGRFIFTDGCGTFSQAVWRRLKKSHSSKQQPTLYQIRYKGTKGMISLNTQLPGHQMLLRPSMIKFTGSPSDEVEICGTNAQPFPLKLNRPLIKILEDLNIEAWAFEDLQTLAVDQIRKSVTSNSSAVEFLKHHLSDSSTGLPALLKALTSLYIDVTEDSFLRDILGALIQVELRDIKYRSRIPVPDGVTLYGICDETGFLEDGEVFVTFARSKSEGHQHLSGRVAVTRSPALHPGDVQLVTAVGPPEDSPLWDLHNAIVFSSKGYRDVPSMLGGGDLDGDLFNILYDQNLIPKASEPPSDYLASPSIDIQRPVSTTDMSQFFIDFMENDQLGRICTLHQVFADQIEEGSRSPQCIALAELASTAVDFSKTGVRVNIQKIPKAPRYRPDFMAPSASTKVEKGITRLALPDSAGSEDGPRYRYYESDRVLGRLYRAINEDLFFEDLQNDTSSLFSWEGTDDVLLEIWMYVQNKIGGLNWQQYIDLATQVRDYYESNMLDIMSQYAISRKNDLTEKEIFIGTIIGRSGAGTRFQREQSEVMKARFNRDLQDIKTWMEDKSSEDDDGFLCLSAACLYVAAQKPSNFSTGQDESNLRSFGWFAAALCVPKLGE